MNSGAIFILVMMAIFLIYFVWRMVTGRSSQTSTKDWLLYFLIAPVMIAAFTASDFYAKNKGIDEYTIVKWMNIVLAAAVVFGSTIKGFWRFRKRWTFWAQFVALIACHFAFLARLRWEQDSYFWLTVVIGLPELVLVFVLFGLMFNRNPNLSGQGRSEPHT